MICPNCKANIDANVKQCPFCGSEIRSAGHTPLGKASLILAILAIVCIVGIFALIFAGVGNTAVIIFVSIFSILCFILPILAIILGAIAYFGKAKDIYGLIGFILGICLIVGAPIGIAATTYVYVSGMIGSPPELTPTITFIYTDQSTTNTLTVVAADPTTVTWADLQLLVNGTVHDHNLSGTVTAGDMIDLTSIAGTGAYTITIRHKSTNTLLYMYEFTAAN